MEPRPIEMFDFAGAKTVELHEWLSGTEYEKPYIDFNKLPELQDRELNKLVRRINFLAGNQLNDDISLRDLYFWHPKEYRVLTDRQTPQVWVDTMLSLDGRGKNHVSRIVGSIIRIQRHTEGRLNIRSLGELRRTDTETLSAVPFVGHQKALAAQLMFRPNSIKSNT